MLVSDAQRTRETWELAGAELPESEGEVPEVALSLPGRDADDSRQKRAGAELVMLVGHNPGMHELASRLAHRNNALDDEAARADSRLRPARSSSARMLDRPGSCRRS